jgi:hypothetical protein
MRTLAVVCMLALLESLAAAPSMAQRLWTVSGHAGISMGNQTESSLAWWGAVHRHVTPAVALGLEAGLHSWEGRFQEDGIRAGSDLPFFVGLPSGPNRLEHVGASLRMFGNGVGSGSAPYLAYGVGVYRQAIISDGGTQPAFFMLGGRNSLSDSRDGRLCLGGSMTLGAAGTGGIKPGAEFRVDLVDTRPGPSAYFTAALGLHANR